MVKIQLVDSNEGFLDVGDDTVFPINFAVADIKDLSKRSGNYSKTITLPSTNNNNQLLNHYFDVNIQAGTFDVTRKQLCLVIRDGAIILDNCYLQLLEVKDNDGLISYSVVIKSSNADFFQTINNLELTDLDISDLNHTLNATNVIASWSNTEGYKYMFPYFEGNQITVAEMLPCIFAKTLFDRIFQRAGYRYDWQTLTDERFDKILIPYNGDGYENKEQDKIITEDTGLNITTLRTSQYTYTLPEIKDVANQYNPANGRYTPNQVYIGENSLKAKVRFVGEFAIYNPSANTIGLSVPSGGTDTIGFNYHLIIRARDTSGFTAGEQLVTIHSFVNGSTIASNTNDIQEVDTTFEFNMVGYQGNPLDLFEFRLLAIEYQMSDGANWSDVNGIVIPEIRLLNHDIRVEVYPANNNLYSGALIDMNQYLPKKVKQSDFIKSIFQMFNLFCDIDKNDPNLLVLQTRDDYYDNGTVKDWTKKISQRDEISTQFLPDVSNKRYLLTYKLDETESNKIYFDNVREIYGQQEYIFDSEFVRDVQTNELIFSPSPFTVNELGMAVNYIQGKKPKTGLRMLYDGGLQDCGLYYLNESVDYDAVSGSLQYPAITHFDNPRFPTFDLNFGVCDYYFTPLVSLTRNNLYNLYWRRTLGQINSGKLLTAYFDLSVYDISTLSLSDRILIGNSYWNINKVIDYDANSDRLTKVELISIDSDVLLTPFDTRTPRDLNGSDFVINIPRGTNIGTTSGSNNNTTTDAVIQGNNNGVFSNAVVLGNDNQVNGNNAMVLGNGNEVGEFQNVLVVGNDLEPTNSNQITTENLVYQNSQSVLNYLVRTIDATTTQAIVLTDLLNYSGYILEAWIVAYEEYGSTRMMGQRLIGVFEVRNGVTTQISSSDSLRKSDFSATVTASYSVVSNNIVLSVTGLAGTPIQWHLNIEIKRTKQIALP
jgi:hypothetical protein